MDKEKYEEIKKEKKYKEVGINKIVINGKQQEGNIISSDDTKDKREINITVYTQDITAAPQKVKGSKINELLQKSIFHNRRS